MSKRFRLFIYLWERYGYERAQMYLASDIKKTKGKPFRHTKLSHYLNGKIQYMQMIKEIKVMLLIKHCETNLSTYIFSMERMEKRIYWTSVMRYKTLN